MADNYHEGKNKKRLGGQSIKGGVFLVMVVILLCGCSSVTQEQIQTVVAYQIQATVFASEMDATSTSLAGTAESVQATITKMYGPTDTPTQTKTPSESPTPSSTPTRTPAPLPNHKVILVTNDKSPLRFVKRENKAGKPVMVIYKSGGKRYVFKQGDKVNVSTWSVIADGGDRYYKVLPGQTDMYGRGIPSSPALYFLARHGDVIN
jgi:uncharacterized protein YceK